MLILLRGIWVKFNKKIFSIFFWLILIPNFYLAAQTLKPIGWVNDFAQIIDPSVEQEITATIKELEQKTSAEIAVVTILSLENEASIEDFAVKLFQEWGIGKKDKDNGVLFLTVVQDKKTRIEVGYGLEPIITDGTAGYILDEFVIPYFLKEDYSQGIKMGTLAIASLIAKESGVELTGAIEVEPDSGKGSLLHLIWILFLIVIFIRHPFLFLFFGMPSFRGGNRGGFGGGFGGFGGGMSGGGGASRGW